MKKPHPAHSKATHATPERAQGKTGASGINKPVHKEKVPQVVTKQTYGKPSQTQKM